MSAQYNPQWLVNRCPNDIQSQIRILVQRGYAVTHQDAKTAQLTRKKRFSFLVAFLSLFVFGVGFLLYLIWFLAKRDDTVYLELDKQQPKKVGGLAAKLGSLDADFSNIEAGNVGAVVLLIIVAAIAFYVFRKFTG